ncbi:MAG: PIG-L family deacetylase [Chloroflexi bacterium]|nr:PIG-L family deacetylase [Chloroflexota bacterium]MBV9897551.1 PIG-L family deacetylase [Chloroflexota bacterium]
MLPSGGGSSSLRRLLVIGAHSDDIEIGCGGTVMRLIRDYPDLCVTWVVTTAHNERMAEARQSANAMLAGVNHHEVLVGPFRDGFLPYDGAAVKEYFEGLKRVQPDLILTHYGRDAHQDHRLVSELTWNTFRDHMILEFEIPKYDGDLGQPNFFVRLDSDLARAKVEHLLEHFPSQHGRRWFTEELFRSMMRIRGMESNATDGYAEAFYCRKAVI